jgi:hypothetical protein
MGDDVGDEAEMDDDDLDDYNDEDTLYDSSSTSTPPSKTPGLE